METFRELEVRGEASELADAVDAIERNIPTGWSRNRSVEAHTSIIPGRLVRCFTSEANASHPSGHVLLAMMDDGLLQVNNIIPAASYQLSLKEYNAILADFFERVIEPFAERFGLDCHLTGAEVGLEDWMPKETADLLERFSTLANRGTGASHPDDRERWNAFVLSAQRTRTRFDPSNLRRWLVEVEGWSPEVADQLALEYEYGRELLSYAADHQVA